jgi:hypothetical protein
MAAAGDRQRGDFLTATGAILLTVDRKHSPAFTAAPVVPRKPMIHTLNSRKGTRANTADRHAAQPRANASPKCLVGAPTRQARSAKVWLLRSGTRARWPEEAFQRHPECAPKPLPSCTWRRPLVPFERQIHRCYFGQQLIGSRILRELRAIGYTGGDRGVNVFAAKRSCRAARDQTWRWRHAVGDRQRLDEDSPGGQDPGRPDRGHPADGGRQGQRRHRDRGSAGLTIQIGTGRR